MYKQCKNCDEWRAGLGRGPAEGQGSCQRAHNKADTYIRGDLEWMADIMEDRFSTHREDYCQYMPYTVEGVKRKLKEAAEKLS